VGEEGFLWVSGEVGMGCNFEVVSEEVMNVVWSDAAFWEKKIISREKSVWD
jgi:hypothetical protein